MLQHRAQERRHRHLRTHFLVAARRAQDDRGPGAQAVVDRVVGGDVAGVQRDHHVQAGGRVVAHVAGVEAQAIELVALGGGVAQVHQRLAQLHAGDLGATALADQPVMHREGQVALAAAEVVHPHRLGRIAPAQAGVGQRRGEHLDETVDLAPLARHRRDQPVLRVGHAQVVPERALQRQQAMLLAVVLLGVRVRGGVRALVVGGRAGAAHPQQAAVAAALGLDGELRLLGAGVQVRVLEGTGGDQAVQQRRHLGQRVVLGDVAGGVAPDQLQVRLAAQHHRAGQHLLEIGLGAAVAAQRQAHQLARGQRGLDQAEEALARGGLRCGLRRGAGNQVGEHGADCR